MEGTALARIAVIVFVALAITAAAIDMARRDRAAPNSPSQQGFVETPAPDPLREQLIRCQELGEAAAGNTECLAAWSENRRRFLGQDRGR